MTYNGKDVFFITIKQYLKNEYSNNEHFCIRIQCLSYGLLWTFDNDMLLTSASIPQEYEQVEFLDVGVGVKNQIPEITFVVPRTYVNPGFKSSLKDERVKGTTVQKFLSNLENLTCAYDKLESHGIGSELWNIIPIVGEIAGNMATNNQVASDSSFEFYWLDEEGREWTTNFLSRQDVEKNYLVGFKHFFVDSYNYSAENNVIRVKLLTDTSYDCYLSTQRRSQQISKRCDRVFLITIEVVTFFAFWIWKIFTAPVLSIEVNLLRFVLGLLAVMVALGFFSKLVAQSFDKRGDILETKLQWMLGIIIVFTAIAMTIALDCSKGRFSIQPVSGLNLMIRSIASIILSPAVTGWLVHKIFVHIIACKTNL